jgi:hypothetical protein
MFLFYICPRSLVLENANKLGEFHMVFLDEAADKVMLKINMKDDLIEQWFSAQDGVESLPHPISGAALAIDPEQAAQISSLLPAMFMPNGTQTEVSAPPMTIHDVIEAISQTDVGAAFRTRVF